MPIRDIVLKENSFYHIYNRGLNKKNIFLNSSNYERFYLSIIRYLQIYTGIRILSYSFLPNHFHLILLSVISGKEISDFMRKIQQSYAIYFKLKHLNSSPDSKGKPVFGGRFKAKLISNEDYLYQCQAYVNYNAVKHKIVTNVFDWEYSSIHQVLGSKIQQEVIPISGYYKDIKKFKDVEFLDLEES
ncbi:transposase [Candidatus Gracilibacteria bacterium]|nr:transposase [Candidatus Gracilibacteria bacterium]